MKGIKNKIQFPECHSALDAESIIWEMWIPAFAGMTFKRRKKTSGFTFVELMVALMVSSIIFSAIATLAFALGAANDSSTEDSTNQARLRYATVRISGLFKQAKLVTQSGTDDLAIWTEDFDNDNKIDPTEVVFIERGSGKDHIALLEFPGAAADEILLEDLSNGYAKSYLVSTYNERRTEIIPQCSNVTFYPTNVNASDSFVCISFDITEDSQSRHYQISSKLLCRAGNLIYGTTVVSSDDD
ncbi:MAG: prepilin-type N-terminal cleavage/methylation domain-containing protein [Sedimentisphaerales bacterium]|nr:prepilin-type N-terminal cleavage/methylation domain-containing protein [Sedimentisphaerales bacterium]